MNETVAEKPRPAPTTRVYVIRMGDAVRLVRAANPARAMSHVTRPFECELADQDALIDALTAVVKVETAGDGE